MKLSMKLSMKRNGVVLLTCVGLGLLVLIGAGAQGSATFTGLRWVPDFSPPTNMPVFPTNLRTDRATPPPQAGHHISTTIDLRPIVWIIAGIAVLVAVLLVVRWLLRRQPRTAEAIQAPEVSAAEEAVAEQEAAEPSTPVVRRGLRQAIDDLASEREPHDAIVKAWLGLQDAAEEAGVRRRLAETPTEFTRRILARVPADIDAVDVLLHCYLQVRFGDHPATNADVDRVRQSLESLAASWESVRRP
jgi:hypothetical protein